MDKIRLELERYRQLKKEQQQQKDEEDQKRTKEAPKQEPTKPSRPWLASVYEVLDAIDPLNALPFRLWRSTYDRWPWSTLALSLLAYIGGQVYFAWCEFGAVFFVISCFVAICLGLGARNQGEASAYSVFNPGCERLLGSMTAEHFERDMMHRRR